MSAPPICEECGAVSSAGARFCANCGGPLASVIQPQSSATGTISDVQPRAALGYSAPLPVQHATADVSRTKTGLLLLIVGTLLGPLPYVNLVGGILAIIGAILVIVGRKEFGAAHSRNTIWSIIIFCVGLTTVFVSSIVFFMAVTSAAFAHATGNALDPATLSQTLSSSFNTLLIGAAIGGAILGIAQVLFTYAIQNQNGKILLWCGYAASLAVIVVEFIIISPLIANAASQSFTGTTYNPQPFNSLQTELGLLRFLGFIPAVLFASALYLAWSQIGKGEIPSTVQQPAKLRNPGPFGKPP